MFGFPNSLSPNLLLIIFIFFPPTTFSITPIHTRKEINDSSIPGLYDGFTKAVILNSTNFKKEIFGGQNREFWLVEFYKHWCGDCMRSVPILKSVAYDIYEWRDVVRLGTIDCANDMNLEICQNHDIRWVPSVRIFKPDSDVNYVGLQFWNGSKTTYSYLRERIAHVIKSYHNEQETINGPVNLKYLEGTDLRRLWNEVPTSVLFFMLVFEPKDSLVGSQVALDISRTNEIKVRLVDPKNKNLAMLLNIEEGKSTAVILIRNINSPLDPKSQSYSQPSFSNVSVEINYVLKENLIADVTTKPKFKIPISILGDNTSTDSYILPIRNFTREGLNKAVRRFIIDHGIPIDPELPKIPIIHRNISKHDREEAIRWKEEFKKALNVKYLSTVIFQMDVEKAIISAITEEVPLKKEITSKELNALRNFISVVIKYFPTQKQGKRLFSEFKARELDNKDTVRGEDIRTTFKELVEKYNPFMPKLEWVGCRGTTRILRGYPCGVWTMFHTLVGLEELEDRNKPDEKPEVLNAMVGYIKYFFSCSKCAEHFTKMAKTIAGNVTTNRDAMMWLWRAHNIRNNWLAGDQTEDPIYPKVQFPIRPACPHCYTHEGASWNLLNVFNFISSMVKNISHLNPADLPYIYTTRTK